MVSFIVLHGLAVVKLDDGRVYGGLNGTLTLTDVISFLRVVTGQLAQ